MSIPITNQDGYLVLGIIGSILLVIALILLVISLNEYRFRTLIIVVLTYTLLPFILITLYQETFASGINAISYDGKGKCNFSTVSEDLLKGECNLILHNHSNDTLSFELQFLESFHTEFDTRMVSLMNLASPHIITIKANEKKSITISELLDVSNVSNHIDGGSSYRTHLILIDGKIKRTL